MSEPPPEPEVENAVEVESGVETVPPSVRWEMAVVILVGIVAPTTTALASYFWPAYRNLVVAQSFAVQEFAGLERALLVGAVMLYVLYRSGESWSLWGICRPKWYDLPLGVAIWLASWFFGDLSWNVFIQHFGDDWKDAFPFPAFNRDSWLDQALLIAFSCANGFAEEVVMRGYLIPRFERVFRSTAVAVVLTSVLFAGYHVYQGVGATMMVLVCGLVFGLSFVALRRLWPLAIAHALADYFVPWLGAVGG